MKKFELNAFSRDITDDELLDDLKRTAARLPSHKGRLTFRFYQKHGKYSAHTVNARFGSWNEGLKKAGLGIAEEKNISIEALFDNLKVVWIAKGRQPVSRDMALSPSKYSASTYSDRFGSWRKALEVFVDHVKHEVFDAEHLGVTPTSGKPKNRTKRNPPLSLRFMVLKRDNFCCTACGKSPAAFPGLVLEVDHVVPWSKGGETRLENLRTLCLECNRGKAARV